MITLAHISDLHLCCEAAENPLTADLRAFSARLRKVLSKVPGNHGPDIHVADGAVLKALHDAIQEVDPDVIVISGDLTTFGDEASFQRFVDWCRTLQARKGGQRTREFLVVPGNHDALLDHFSRLWREKWSDLPWWARVQVRQLVRYALRPLRAHLNLESTDDDLKLLKAYSTAIPNGSFLHTRELRLKVADGFDLQLTGFNTVSGDAKWLNAGTARDSDWAPLTKEPDAGAAFIRVAVAHHSPIAARSGSEDALASALNAMPEGHQFLANLQRFGVDLLLHGHHHEFWCLKVDCDHQQAGHAFAVACPASSSATSGGFNLFKIANPHAVELQHFKYEKERGFVGESSRVLPLERHRPEDSTTLSARYELKHYIRAPEADEHPRTWKEVQQYGGDLVYMSGRSFGHVLEKKFEVVEQVLTREKGRVRLLLSDPQLLQYLSTSARTHDGEGGGVRPAVAMMLGEKEELDDLGRDAARTLDGLRKWIAGTLSAEQRRRIAVHTVPTLLPFGAYVDSPDKPWGRMAVKVLPLGALGVLTPPVIRLNRRGDRALFEFYLAHLRYLFLKGTQVAGELADDGDLRQELESDILDAIDRRKGLPGDA